MINTNVSPEAWRGCLAIVRPALLLAPSSYLRDMRHRLAQEGIQAAVKQHDTAALFDWIVGLLDRQGISNSAAIGFAQRHGSAGWQDVEAVIAEKPLCSKLRSHWHFHDCGYRKDAYTCARPDLLSACALPRLPARKGSLNQAAFSLALFIRDVAGGDLVGWIDDRLAAADPGAGAPARALTMRASLLAPLTNVVGTGSKVWSMIIAELLLGGDPARERWVTAGASFVAVDSLIHNFVWRSGILRRLDAEHGYGAGCYAPGGCAEVIAALAERIDAREFNPAFPACFPRWVQFAIWSFCAEGGWSICNGRNIDDRAGCQQVSCPAFRSCDKIAIKPYY